MRALGLMSGTSMDGISVALIETDGETVEARVGSMTFPYNAAQRSAIAGALAEATAVRSRHERPGSLAVTERLITELHAAAVSAYLRHRNVARSSIDVVGFHGQTVLHRPDVRLTVQLGDGPLLAELTGLPVIYDLRARDVAAGGQGAPLVPIYHAALLAGVPERPLGVLNIGGVANLTYIRRDGDLLAFDTGPGNALLDDWIAARTGLAFDDAGAHAARGRVQADLLHSWLCDPYFATPPPKSLDRGYFRVDGLQALSTEDGAATLTEFTAAAVARAREHLPEEPHFWIVSGGGRKNRTLMSLLAGYVENAVVPAEAFGFDGDAIEAEAWAFLAVRCMKGLPVTFPGTTGICEPTTAGTLARPSRPFGLQ